ncbi:MAG: ABC transporter substrate-binding protein [Candidatus Thorarchaeota archaeon]
MMARSIQLFIFCTLVLSVLSFNAAMPCAEAAVSQEGGSPFLNKVVYNVITQDDQQVLALQNDMIDLIGDMVDPAFLPSLAEAENIEVANVLRNGYGSLIINCEKYPLNITTFRRAFAFAFDKEAVSDDVWDGLSQPIDSCVPSINPFSIEGQLPYTYYEGNIALGNYFLDIAGFYDVDEDGFREAPDGSDFDVTIECAQSSNIAIQVGALAADALTALNIDATSVPADFYEYLNRLYFHGNYDVVFLGSSFSDFDVDWLAYEFWSEYADEPYWNFPNFKNASYDAWRDQLLHSVEYDDVYEAAIVMQKIWVHACPMVICYENILLSAYRTDKFEGWKNDVNGGVPGFWTNMMVHLKAELGGPYGGTLRWGNPLDIDTFNFMASSSAFTMNVLEMLYDSLIRQDWNGDDIMWLAESYMAETHDDNPNVPNGYTRFTFQMIQNATWTDGTPLTAEDVAFTLNYYSDAPGNPYGTDLTQMTAAYASSNYTVVIEFSTESFWHLHTVSYKPIIPKHIFEDIGLDQWNLWNPNPPAEEMVTSGPFIVSDYEPGEFTELTRNPNYFIDRDVVLNAPDIVPVDDFTMNEGTSADIAWNITDDNPDRYEILHNGDFIRGGAINSTEEVIRIQLESYGIGIHEFTLTAYDKSGLTSEDSVIVIILDTTSPVLNHPPDISYAVGDTGNNITWTPADRNPTIFMIIRNDEVIRQGYWEEGDEIAVNVDGLSEGMYNYTIVVFDAGVNFAFDSVYVNVVNTTPTTPIFGENILSIISISITIGSIGVIVIVVTLVVRSRRSEALQTQWTFS